jgi:hypothetical protein
VYGNFQPIAAINENGKPLAHRLDESENVSARTW